MYTILISSYLKKMGNKVTSNDSLNYAVCIIAQQKC